MKSKKSTVPDASFEALSDDFARRIERERITEEMKTSTNAIIERANILRNEHMFKWLIEQATKNFQKQLSSNNPCLLNHFIALFRDRAHSVTDTTGVSGFALPPSKMRIVPGTKNDQEIIPGIGEVHRIINADHRPSVSVHALIIYSGLKDENVSVKLPDIVLVIKTDGLSRKNIAAKHLANCRVALIEWGDCGGNPVSPDTNFPGNQDYMLKLVELSTPGTMFEQVFRHHGPAKIN